MEPELLCSTLETSYVVGREGCKPQNSTQKVCDNAGNSGTCCPGQNQPEESGRAGRFHIFMSKYYMFCFCLDRAHLFHRRGHF